MDEPNAVDSTRTAARRLASAPEPLAERYPYRGLRAGDRRSDEERERAVNAYAERVAWLEMDGVDFRPDYVHVESDLGPDHDDDDREQAVTTETLFCDSAARAFRLVPLGDLPTNEAMDAVRAEIANATAEVVERCTFRFNGTVPEGYELVARFEVRRAEA